MYAFMINERFTPFEIGMLNQHERENGHTRIGQKFKSDKPWFSHSAILESLK